MSYLQFTVALVMVLGQSGVASLPCDAITDENTCSCTQMGNMCRTPSRLMNKNSGNDQCVYMSTEDCPTDCEWINNECLEKQTDDAGCMSNKKENCADCMKMGDMCMSKTNPCKGHESNCTSIPNCKLDNGSCVVKMDPCMGATFCGDCYWTMNMCMPEKHPSGGGTGQMIMTFFGGHDVVVLFDTAHAKTVGQYIGALIVTILGGLFTNITKDIVTRHESLGLPLRTLLMISVFTISNLVMLVVMIMNTGLFIAAMTGYTIGWCLVEHFRLQRGGDIQGTGIQDCHSP